MVAVSVPHQWRLQDFAATHFADAKRQASEVSLVRASLDSAAEQQEACEKRWLFVSLGAMPLFLGDAELLILGRIPATGEDTGCSTQDSEAMDVVPT